MADYSDCIRNMRETASVLDEVAQKRQDKRAELREIVDFSKPRLPGSATATTSAPKSQLTRSDNECRFRSEARRRATASLSPRKKSAITRHFTARQVPVSTPGRLLLASWNVANLGVQGRSDGALDVIAHIMKRFDLLAVQEINEEFRVFEKVVRKMGSKFEFILTDTAGNDERLAYV